MSKYEVWYAIPSACEEKANRNLPKWRDAGYRVAVLQDRFVFPVPSAEVVVKPFSTYQGWSTSVNWLCRYSPLRNADIVVTGGDDMLPDPNRSAQSIAAEFYARFPDGFGIMQPIGDTKDGTDRICGSPWMGRGWIDRANMGTGPLWSGYVGFYADEELFEVSRALRNGENPCLWQRKDLCQFHEHWTRHGAPGAGSRPAYSEFSQSWWTRDQELFKKRKEAGFPGSSPLPAAGFPTARKILRAPSGGG